MTESDSHFKATAGSERSFGLVFAVVFSLIGFLPLLTAGHMRWWALVCSVLFLLVALRVPHWLALPNRLWFRFGMLLGLVVGGLVMMLLFYTVLMPMGLLMKLVGKDILQERLDKSSDSYWIQRETPVGSMKNQF